MQNLIISIIAVAIIVVLTASGMYYGGDIYHSQTVEAEAAKMRNERNQLVAAVEIFKADGNELGDTFSFTDLVDAGYLNKVPDGWIAEDDYAYRELDKHDPGSLNVCYEANSQDGLVYNTSQADVIPVPDGKTGTEAVPLCTKVGIPLTIPCCIHEY